jgi:hypothetical protein
MSGNSNTHCNDLGMVCSVTCPRCHALSLDRGDDIYCCDLHWVEIIPREIDTTPGVGQ